MRPLRRSIAKSTRRREQRLRKSFGPLLGLGLILTSGSAVAEDKEDIQMLGLDVNAQRREYRVLEPSLFKMPDLVKDTPQSITIIPRELMREQAIFSMREALRNVSGLSLNAGEGGTQGDNLTLRGYSARNDIYLDGVRDAGSYTRDVFNLQSIEVLKGPSATMFGRGSTGGVINQVTKTPERERFYDMSGTIGTGPVGRITLDFNQPITEQVGLRLNALFYQGEVVGRDEVDFQRIGLAPSVAIGLGSSTRLTMTYLYQRENSTPDNGLPYLFGEPVDVNRNNFYGLPENDYQKTTVHIGTVRLDHEFNQHLKLRSTLRYANYHLDQEAVAPRIVGAPTPATPLESILVNRGIVARDREDSIFAFQTDLVARFDTWFMKHTLTAGVEYDLENADVSNFTMTGVPQATLVNPNMFPDISTIRKTLNTKANTTASTVSFYVVDEIALLSWLKVLGGVRFDHFQADFESRASATGLTTKFDRTDDVPSPRAALVVQPTPMQTYYFAWGSSFNPSAEALTLAANTVDTDPERTYSYEIGAKWQLIKDRLSVNTALFRIDKTDARTAEPGSPVQTLDGKQRSQGFELEVLGRPLPDWNVFANYTYLDTEVLESKDVQGGVPVQGKRLIAAPEHSFSFWSTYDFLKYFQVGAGVTYVTERAANTSNTNTLPSYVRADLTFGFFPWKNTEFRVNVLNISDARYFDHVYQAHTPPAPGRTILFTGDFPY
jgi:catecholate siderophore receptor